jgi:hypothetical protein
MKQVHPGYEWILYVGGKLIYYAGKLCLVAEEFIWLIIKNGNGKG